MKLVLDEVGVLTTAVAFLSRRQAYLFAFVFDLLIGMSQTRKWGMSDMEIIGSLATWLEGII